MRSMSEGGTVPAVGPGAASRVGIVGAGVIGGGWALHYLRMGLHVDVHDPGPGARDGLLRMLESSWPVLERLGLRPGASPDRLTFCRTLGDAVGGADVVQENCPEDAALKRRVLADIDAAAPPEVVIASSTSGFAMTMLQADCANPQRCVVGHPFNPPYLIPLVVVAAGEATVEEIDASIAWGPGLRWAQMGPCLTFHLAGGSGGIVHMLDHFGAALLEPWTRLEAPALTPRLRERMVDGCLRVAAGRSVADLERLRDEFLAELIPLVERYSAGGL